MIVASHFHTFPYISYPFFTWILWPVDWKPCIAETWHHLQVWAPTFFRLEMDASKSPIRFFTRARMNRKCGWFLQDAWGAARITDSNRILRILSNIVSQCHCTFHVNCLYHISSAIPVPTFNRNTTKAAEDSDCFSAKPLRACFSALAWNHFHRKRRFQKEIDSSPASSCWSKEMWDFASKYLGEADLEHPPRGKWR